MLPKLPQNDSDETRKAKLFKQQLNYRYVYDWPPGVATAVKLYDDDGYSKTYTAESLPIYLEIAKNSAGQRRDAISHKEPLSLIRSLFSEMKQTEFRDHIFTMNGDMTKGMPAKWPDNWEEYEHLFQSWDKPPIVPFFSKSAAELDLSFAWQRMAGCNPMMLRRCDELPGNFPVTEAIYQGVMGGKDTLEAARKERRLYIADYAILDGAIAGVTNHVQKFLAAPLSLYAVEQGSGALRPVAIQCGQVPGDAFPIFTPQDNWHWRMAMTFVQVADANTHEGIAHLGRTHLVMEAVVMAAKRQLAPEHPLHRLLAPHWDHTLAINDSAKFSLTAPDGTVDNCFGPRIDQFGALVLKALQTLSWDNLDPRKDLAARGLDDAEALPNHPYREDAPAVWDEIRKWVATYVGQYYSSAEDVQGDHELAAFVTELSAQDGGRLPGPAVPKTVEEVVEVITRMVFTASAQHSAVNFSQFPFMGMVPNMPGAAYVPPPTAETPNDVAEYSAMLPPMNIAMDGTNMVYLLSALQISTLGKYSPGAFMDPRLVPEVRRFQRALKDLDEVIAERDSRRFIPYPFLRPTKILQSISI